MAQKKMHWPILRFDCYGNSSRLQRSRQLTGWHMLIACPTMQRSRPKMFDYSQQIEAFREKKVRLSSDFKEKLLAHRAANRKRLVSRLPNHLEQVHIGEANFKPQGSVAMGTIIQTRFANEEYDIDDGLVL